MTKRIFCIEALHAIKRKLSSFDFDGFRIFIK